MVTALKNNFVLQACDFLCTFSLLSLVAMFHYIRFPQLTHSKYVGNRKQTCWKKKGTLGDTNYSETSIKQTPSGPSQVSA